VYSRTLEAQQPGPMDIDLEGYNSNIDVTAEDFCTRARVELYTDVSSGPTVELIDKLHLTEYTGTVKLHLPEEAGGGSVQINNFSGGGMFVGASVVVTGGNADMVVNGQRIQVRGGQTYVNGLPIDGAATGKKPGDPPSIIHIRATVPAGSTGRVKTYNGNVITVDLPGVRLTSYNGNVKATGLTQDSRLQRQRPVPALTSSGMPAPTPGGCAGGSQTGDQMGVPSGLHHDF
jgi:hypothetical protein